MSRSTKIFLYTFLAAVAVAVWPVFAPGPKTRFPADEFARLPILEGGRVKPVDSFARNSLLLIRGTQTLQVEGRTRSASEWLLDALFRPEAADTLKVFVIDDPDVLGLLGLEQTERRFAYWQIERKRDEIEAQAQRADMIEAGRRTRFQSAVLDLYNRLALYERVKNTVLTAGETDPAADLAEFSAALPAAMGAAHKPGKAGAKALEAISRSLERYRFMADAAAFRPIPPGEGLPDDAWASYGDAALRPAVDDAPNPGLTAWALMASAYRQDDPAAFGAALREYRARLNLRFPAVARAARQERAFNAAQPFISGMTLYVVSLLLIFAWWATRRDGIRAAALGAFAAGVLVHTAGLAARVWLQGRPPVTNLYSSAVFVGWTGALLGLLAERAHKQGFAAAGGALLGFCTLLVAQHLGASGDTMEMMRAVLDSNFWLGTHVITVTIGYGATFLAGALGIAWALRRRFVRNADPETTRALVSLAYGVVAFSLLFSFIGTTLGGIWADQSWGRFWGWDPKENGALLIVLWNAFILHARFAGHARERGIMVMIVFGNIVTAISWFGVNMLGIGLHSYGFMDKAFWWLAAFCASQLAIMALGWLPARSDERAA